MARSEFRWNKKRRHYAYLHKDVGSKRKNILISSKPTIKNRSGKSIITNVPLYHHPNDSKDGEYYVVPRIISTTNRHLMKSLIHGNGIKMIKGKLNVLRRKNIINVRVIKKSVTKLYFSKSPTKFI